MEEWPDTSLRDPPSGWDDSFVRDPCGRRHFSSNAPSSLDILIEGRNSANIVVDNERDTLPTEMRGLGFGAGALGNLYREISDADAMAALHTALDHGVKYFDTAPHYGFGLSEKRL